MPVLKLAEVVVKSYLRRLVTGKLEFSKALSWF